MKQNRLQKQRLVQFRQWSNKRFGAFNSLHKLVKICTLAVAYSLLSEPVAVKAEGGDSTSLKTLEMDDVLVLSTLIELKNAETGRSIEVIQGAQIQSLPVTSVDELLRYIPGIDAQQRGAFGAQTDFSLRGSNFNQVLVLIDGLKINDPLTAHFNSNIPLSPSEIERIEIIRGAASAEYGPDATGGVINIFTKTFSRNKQTKPIQADGKIMAGQNNLKNADGGFCWQNDLFTFSGGGLYNKSDGNTLESGLKNYFDINTLSLSGRYNISEKTSASYRFSRDYRDFNAQWFYTSNPYDKAIEKIERYRHQVLIENSGEKYSTQLLASYNTTNDYYLFMPGMAPNDNNSSVANIQLRQGIKHTTYFNTLIGLSAENKGVQSNDRGNHDLLHYGSFITTSYRGVYKLSLNGGLRGDYDKTFGFFVLPQIGVSYKISNYVIARGSLGRSVRTPDFTELYTNNFRTDTLKTGTAIGNPNLNPEKSWNSELGLDIKPLIGLMFNITGFFRKSEGIVDYVSTPDSAVSVGKIVMRKGNFWFAQNNSNTNTLGIETRLSYSILITNNFQAKIIAGYTYLNLDASFDKESRYALLQPKHLFNGDLQFNIGPVLWTINGVYKIRNAQANTTINRNLKAEYGVWNTNMDVNVYKNIAFLSLAIYNALDANYSDFLGAEMPGRWIAGGIKVRL